MKISNLRATLAEKIIICPRPLEMTRREIGIPTLIVLLDTTWEDYIPAFFSLILKTALPTIKDQFDNRIKYRLSRTWVKRYIFLR